MFIGSRLRRVFEPEELVHVLVVLFLAEFRAQVEAQLVDHLDAVVAQPVVPAVGTDLAVDANVDVVRKRRAGELSGPVARETPRSLAAEPGPRSVVLRLCRLGNRGTLFAEQAGHIVAWHLVAALVRDLPAARPDVDRLALAAELQVRLAEELEDLGKPRAQLQGPFE